jgi:hypothetical protein
MKELLNIDLVAVDCVKPEMSVKALIHSSKYIKFGSVKLLAHYQPQNLPDHIEFYQIQKQTHDTMSWFHTNTLPKYINNEYMLSIQSDGFILNPHNWLDEFLNYDYIGAPWPVGLEWCKRNRVGNGGFVLKSKKFLNLEESLPYSVNHNDVYVTNTYYDFFTYAGCKYAPIELACKFSLEMEVPECEFDLTKVFGYHGKCYSKTQELQNILNQYE